MRHWCRTVAETLEKRAVKPSCWKRKTSIEMGPMGAGIVAAVVAICGIEGWNQGARCMPVEHCRLLDEFKRVSGTLCNNRNFGNDDVADTMTVNGRRRHQDIDGVIVLG